MAAYSTDGRSTGVPSATEDPTGRSDGLRARVVRHRPRRADDMTVADADAVRLPVATAALGALAAAFVLPHLPDLPGALGEIRRALRPGAAMVLAGWAGSATSPFTGLAATLLRERAVPEVRDILTEAE